MILEKMEWIKEQQKELKNVVDILKSDVVSHKIMMQKLDHDLASAHQEVVSDRGKTNEILRSNLAAIKSIYAQITVLNEVIKEHGRIIHLFKTKGEKS